jgi:CrcB protein
MEAILYVGAGGFTGSVMRYLIGQYLQGKATGGFPVGTLTVNIIGCFVIGLVYALASKGQVSSDWKLFLVTGICGGFTTFSAFSNDILVLFKSGNTISGIIYLSVSVIAGILATIAAYSLVKP